MGLKTQTKWCEVFPNEEGQYILGPGQLVKGPNVWRTNHTFQRQIPYYSSAIEIAEIYMLLPR